MSGDVSHSTHLPQCLQFLHLFVVVVWILSIILQDELEEKKQKEQKNQVPSMLTLKKGFKNPSKLE